MKKHRQSKELLCRDALNLINFYDFRKAQMRGDDCKIEMLCMFFVWTSGTAGPCVPDHLLQNVISIMELQPRDLLLVWSEKLNIIEVSVHKSLASLKGGRKQHDTAHECNHYDSASVKHRTIKPSRAWGDPVRSHTYFCVLKGKLNCHRPERHLSSHVKCLQSDDSWCCSSGEPSYCFYLKETTREAVFHKMT